MSWVRTMGVLAIGATAGVVFVVSCGRDAASGAEGTTGGGTCGTCSVSGPISVNPVQVTGVTKMITAESDPNQLKSFGLLAPDQSTGYAMVSPGPLVVSDASFTGGCANDSATFFFSDKADCTGTQQNLFAVRMVESGGQCLLVQNMSGGHFFVPAGRWLCASGDAFSIAVSGYVPYASP